MTIKDTCMMLKWRIGAPFKCICDTYVNFMRFKDKQSGFSAIELMFVLAVMVALAGVLLYPRGAQSKSVKQFQQEVHNAVFLARRLSVVHDCDVKLSINENKKKIVISFTDQDNESQKHEFDIITEDISDCEFYSIVETERKNLKSRERKKLDFVSVRSKYCQPFELSFKFEDKEYSIFIDRFCQMTSTFPESMLYGK